VRPVGSRQNGTWALGDGRALRSWIRGVFAVKPIVTAVVVAVFVLAIPATAAAQGEYQVDRSPVRFTITSEACPRLPAGSTVEGRGRQKSVTRTIAGTVVNYTRASGRATDQDGNRYVFDYRNSFHVANTAAAPATYTGTMFDLFSVAGRGPATLRNGFVAIFTTDLGPTSAFQPLYAWGDPIDFVSGAARCDPL
jgi:hypothetical protein